MIDANADALCFLPNNAPVWLCDLGPGGAVAIELPAGLEVRVRERFSDVLGATITAATGAAAFLRGFLETLDAQPPTYRPDSPSWVQTCVCEITERVLTESTGTRPSPAQRALSTARDYVIMHLTDPGLTPDRVAREAAVSLRTLNRLFAADGDSVGGCIRRCRLERCRIDLLDPAKADRTISQIGATWGFPEAAHFSRVFKDAYGCSPRAFRSGPAITHEQSGFSVHRVA